jgi:hypothetical protein
VKNYAGFNLLAWLGSCAVVVALAGCGDRETVQSTPAPAPAQTPMTPAEMYAKEKLQEYRAANNDDQAWAVFAAACTANTLIDTEARASVAPMISDGWESWPLPGKTQPPASVAARLRQDAIFNRFALVYAAGFPDAWGGKSMRMSLIRYMLVRDRVRAGLGKLEPHERQMVKDEMVEACQQGIYRQTVDFCTEVNNWDGWEPAERQEFARMFLVSTNFTGFDKKLLGRDDDGLEELMRDEVVKRWSADRTVLWTAIACLNNRNDTKLLPILLSMKEDFEQHSDNTGCVPMVDPQLFLSGPIWRARMTVADPATLIDLLENEVEGSRAYGYGRGDEMRLVVCERLLAAGVPPDIVRQSFYNYVTKLNPSNPPNAAWSRPVRSLAILKRRLIDLGVLTDSDLPGVQAPRALPRIEE